MSKYNLPEIPTDEEVVFGYRGLLNDQQIKTLFSMAPFGSYIYRKDGEMITFTILLKEGIFDAQLYIFALKHGVAVYMDIHSPFYFKNFIGFLKNFPVKEIITQIDCKISSFDEYMVIPLPPFIKYSLKDVRRPNHRAPNNLQEAYIVLNMSSSNTNDEVYHRYTHLLKSCSLDNKPIVKKALEIIKNYRKF
jgi:hypothetical protein